MDTNKLNSLLKQGENENLDFKMELHLETAEQKAEFVKDVISLANSAQGLGFLVIGIDKKSNVVGIDRLEEERIQQIAHTYIYPNVIVHCYRIEIESSIVGIIEIQGVERPHRVIKNIDRLIVNDVFIRHGSTVAKASPDEMFRMRKKITEMEFEAQSLCDSAQKHLLLGNVEQAIIAYSKAIALMPTPENLLACGHARMMTFESNPDNYLYDNLCVPVEIGALALKDFSDALKLEESSGLEKDIRLSRMELLSICPIDDPCWDEDFAWAEDNISDFEYSKVLLFASLRIEMYAVYAYQGWDADKLINIIDHAIYIGLEDAQAYRVRAIAHQSNRNLGLALKDINLACNIAQNKNNPRLFRKCLSTRAEILQNMGQYEAAYDDIKNALTINLPDNKITDITDSFLGDIHRLTDDIYQRVAVQWILRTSPDEYLNLYKLILQLLVLQEGQPKYFRFSDDKETLHEVPGSVSLEKEFPIFAPVLRKIIGKEIWQAASEGREYSFRLTISPKNNSAK